MTLDRTSPLPLWAQVLASIEQRVAIGEFADSFPSELEVATSYGVSRNTAREALRRLRATGTVIAGRGRRPRLAAGDEIEQPLGAIYSLFASVAAAGMSQASIVRSLEMVVDERIAVQLDLPPTAELFHLERLRVADDLPLALDHLWCDAVLAEKLIDVNFSYTAFYDALARHTGIRLTGGQEHLRIVVPTQEERELLRIGPNTGAVRIDRRGFSSGVTVEWRETLIRGDRFAAKAVFSAESGYRLDIAGVLPGNH